MRDAALLLQLLTPRSGGGGTTLPRSAYPIWDTHVASGGEKNKSSSITRCFPSTVVTVSGLKSTARSRYNLHLIHSYQPYARLSKTCTCVQKTVPGSNSFQSQASLDSRSDFLLSPLVQPLRSPISLKRYDLVQRCTSNELKCEPMGTAMTPSCKSAYVSSEPQSLHSFHNSCIVLHLLFFSSLAQSHSSSDFLFHDFTIFFRRLLPHRCCFIFFWFSSLSLLASYHQSLVPASSHVLT